MNRLAAVTLAVVLYALSLPFNVGAVDYPHYDVATGITCATCHTGQLTLGSTGYNNVCQSCHRPGDVAGGKKPITLADAANPYGNHSTAGISKLFQTSHRWDGPDTVPAAGALPPIQAAMTTSYLRSRSGNSLACVRCHNQHFNTNTPFLRVPNNQDQLCLDCHRSRNVQTHLKGSHPVNINYNSATGALNKPPVNSNPANPSSDLNARLIASGGNLLCSTCHGVHYTDSRSSTIDGSAGFASLSSGDGFLLRSDRRGAATASGQPDKSNICTNCHAGKKSHNLLGQDIQCVDCHGAHVEYDPNDPTASKGTNIFLIRRNVINRTTGQAGQIFFRYTGSQREYRNDQGTGVCQGCHAVPLPGGKYPVEHTSSDPKVCNTCHFHNSSSGSFSGGCGSCHGVTAATTPATGGHLRHAGTGVAGRLALACSSCHGAITGISHINGSVQWDLTALGSASGYKTPAGVYALTGSTGTAAPSAAYGQCANMYCHSTVQGGGGLGAPVYSQPAWGGSALTCGGCHKDMAVDATAPGSHAIHAQTAAIACSACHSGLGKDTVGHANGSINLAFTGSAANTAYSKGNSFAAGLGYGSCSANLCHGQGTPSWGGTLWSTTDQCGKCHSSAAAGAVTAAVPFYGTSFPAKITANTDPKVGAHTSHITGTDSLSGALSCADCHGAVTLNSAAHMNGSTGFVWSALATTGGLVPSYNVTTGSCSNVYCHGAKMSGGDTSGTNRTPTWNVAFLPATISAAGCGTCHGFPPSAASGHPAVTIPAGFPATASIGTTCSCHSNINPAGNSYATIFVNKALHINGTMEIAAGGGCDSCHGYPPVRAGFVGTHGNWSSAKTENYPGGGGAHTIHNHVNRLAKPSEGFANCSNCHAAADHQMSPIAFNPGSNINVSIKRSLRIEAAKQVRYTSNRLNGNLHVTGTCSNISCHYGATPKWDPSH